MTLTRLLFLLTLLTPLALPQVQPEAEDQRLQEIMRKRRRSEPVTDEEQVFVKTVIARRSAEFQKANPPRNSTGLVPLSELPASATYQGEPGGLYPGGRNTPPDSHLRAGLALARRIVPLDAAGRPSPDGKIVLLSIGMSNTTQEFQAFQKLAAAGSGANLRAEGADPPNTQHPSPITRAAATGLHPRLVIVDGAQGGQAADTTADPQAAFWKVAGDRLTTAGVTDRQVQAVWLKQAIIQPRRPFPAEAKRLQGYLVDTLHNLAPRYPNLKIAYLSSRIYAGYATTVLNPEPHAYESAFAVRWVIASQIAGHDGLNYDPSKGPVRSPWLAWGPYLWADGAKARSDGLAYLPPDLGPDGTHPSPSGREKVAQLLLDFLKKDPASRPWFLQP